MGRHSAPGADDDGERLDAGTATATRHPRPARHAQGNEPDEAAGDAGAKPAPEGATTAGSPAAATKPPATGTKTPKPPRITPSDGLDLIEDALYGVPADSIPAEPLALGKTAPNPKRETDGRAAKDESADPAAAPVEPVAPVAAAERVEPVAAKTQTDIELLKTRGDVRARVVAAVVVPFVLYAVVLTAIGSFGWRVFLIWIWIPLVTAGIIVGLFLDAGHRTQNRAEPPSANDEAG